MENPQQIVRRISSARSPAEEGLKDAVQKLRREMRIDTGKSAAHEAGAVAALLQLLGKEFSSDTDLQGLALQTLATLVFDYYPALSAAHEARAIDVVVPLMSSESVALKQQAVKAFANLVLGYELKAAMAARARTILEPLVASRNEAVANNAKQALRRLCVSRYHEQLLLQPKDHNEVDDIVSGQQPSKSCEECMRELARALPEVTRIEDIIVACTAKVATLSPRDLVAANLSPNMVFAIFAYTYDLGLAGHYDSVNLFDALNKMLRERDPEKLMSARGFLYYLMKGLEHLSAVQATVYRGIPATHLPDIQRKYTQGRKVRWTAFSSTTTSIDTAKGFAQEEGGVILRVNLLSGRCVSRYSFFPDEDEVLLSPNARFIVTSGPTLEDDGYYYVDLTEEAKNLEEVVF